MRWLGDKSLGSSRALPPGRAHVRGLSRTWVEQDGRPGFPVRCTGHDRVCGFQKESRMKFANATKLHRKSGEAPPFSFPASRCRPGGESIGKRSCATHVRESPRTWGTRPGGKAWWEAGKAEDDMTANRRTELKSFISLLTRHRPSQSPRNDKGEGIEVERPQVIRSGHKTLLGVFVFFVPGHLNGFELGLV